MSVLWEPPVPDSVHKCNTPMREVFITAPPPLTFKTSLGTTPDQEVGTIWMCDECGQMWTVDYFDGILKHGYTPSCYHWRHSNWRERFKVRHIARRDPRA